MAASTVAMPAQSLSQQNLQPGNTAGSDSSSLHISNKSTPPVTQTATPQTDNLRLPTPHASGAHPFHRTPYQFRPRFPPNRAQDDAAAALLYDGKRMRKAIHRKTVDYNPTVLNYIQNRIWQRDRRDRHHIQPDALYAVDLVPPPAMLEQPMNAVTTRFVRTSTNKYRCPIFCVTWTPEGRRLVTGASSGEFTLWNGLTFNFETILQAHETAVRAMRWSHSDSWMVTADHAGYIKYWQSNMNNVKMYQAHKEPVRGISFCPSDTKFASCSDDGTIRLWDFMRCHEEKILRGHGADVRCVDWHPQKALIASGSKDNQQPVKLWDPRTGHSIATLHAHKHTVMDLKWNQNGNWMLTASRDHLLKLFDVRNLKEELQTFKGHKREATAIGWHPIHEGLFASGSADGALMFWMVGCDHEVGGMEEAHEGMVWSLAWHPLGHILASGSNDHATKFWTRNRPGDEMRDKYNLNTLPLGMMEQELLEYNLDTTLPNLPGIGLEQEASEGAQIKEEQDENELPSIPGLTWEEDAVLLKVEEKASQKKVPYARPVPKVFEQAWTGEIDIDQLKKEQLQHQLQQQKAQFMPQSSLLLAQQFIGAAIGTLRQQLAANEAARMMLPRGQLLLRPGAPRMLIAPGQPVVGPHPGQMVLFPGVPAITAQSLGQLLLQHHNNANSQQQQQQQGIPGNMAANTNNQANAGGAQNMPGNNMAPPQQGGQAGQAAAGHNQGQLQPQAPGPGQVRPVNPHGGNRPPGQMMDSQGQMRPPGQIGDPKGSLRPPGGPKGDSQGMRPPGQNADFQGHNRLSGGQMGDPKGPPRPQGQMGDGQGEMRHPGQMRDSQGQMKQLGLLGPAPHLQGQGQQPGNLKAPSPGQQFQAPNGAQGQFGSGPLLQRHGNRGPQDLDRDDRYQGQSQGPGAGQRSGGLDQDFRHPVYNGPAGPTSYEDQDLRQPASGPGHSLGDRQPNTGGELRNRDFQGSAGDRRGQGQGDDLRGSHTGGRNYNEEENYAEFGDVDERFGEERDFDRARGQGRGGRSGGYDTREEEYGRQYADENWDNGGFDEGGYGNEYEEQEGRGDRGMKRVWDEGPGHREGRSNWGDSDGRGHTRGGFRGNRGRGGGYKGGGWERGARGAGGDRGGRGDGGDRGARGDGGDRGGRGSSGDRGGRGSSGDRGGRGSSGDRGGRGSGGDRGGRGAGGDRGGRGAGGDRGTRGTGGDRGTRGAGGDRGGWSRGDHRGGY